MTEQEWAQVLSRIDELQIHPENRPLVEEYLKPMTLAEALAELDREAQQVEK